MFELLCSRQLIERNTRKSGASKPDLKLASLPLPYLQTEQDDLRLCDLRGGLSPAAAPILLFSRRIESQLSIVKPSLQIQVNSLWRIR